MTPKLKDFYEKGMAFIKAKKASGLDPCTAIMPGTREWNAWGAYFRDEVGSFPAYFREIERQPQGGKSFTVPAQWPWWVDTLGYRHAPVIHYKSSVPSPDFAPRNPEEKAIADKLVSIFKGNNLTVSREPVDLSRMDAETAERWRRMNENYEWRKKFSREHPKEARKILGGIVS